jgi:acetylornithine deacetylase/succinyl-diaminopimelate desuccinylase-like protein
MGLEELHREVDKAWPNHLKRTRELLRIPSVSFTGEGIQESADALQAVIEKLGVKAGQFRATRKSHPLIHGHLDVGAERTVLLYGMYDVQPVGDLDAWKKPPFAATIVRSHGEDVLINRGVYNSKAALSGTLLAIETMVNRGEMPVNVRFLLEGEEELGGESLPTYVMKNKSVLSKADAAFGFDYCENEDGVPCVTAGMKGCLYFDLITDGKNQGGPLQEIHSSDAVWVKSPVWRLMKAISTFVDEDQVPSVDGIWDDVKGPSKEDRELIKVLAKRIDLEAYKRSLGVDEFKLKGSKEELLEKYMFEPSLNICGFEAGYNGEGTKTVLPSHAKVKIDIRLVPNMTVEGTMAKVIAHMKKRGFNDVKIRRYVDYPYSKVPAHVPPLAATIEAMRYHGKDPEVWPMTAGSAPFHLFDEIGVPWGGAGLGHGGNAHAPNEWASVEGMKAYEKGTITTLWKYAQMTAKGRRKL